jgi:microcystin-dependent protein
MINFINKAFLSFVIFITSYSLVVAQTAALLPNAVQQFFDNNGNPLTSGNVYTYIPGTTTPKITWKDSAETPSLQHTNPIILNAAGRPPNDTSIYGQGSYRQVVKDANGNLIWDQLTAPGNGGGGSAGTGDGDLVGTVKPWAGITAPNQYVFAYGQELLRTTYSILFSAITQTSVVICTNSSNVLTGLADTTAIPLGAHIELNCVTPGTQVNSKTSSTLTLSNPSNISVTTTAIIFPFGNGNGTTTFQVPDLRGLTVVGRANMGGLSTTILNSTFYGTDPNSIGAIGGHQSHTLVQGELPAFKPAITITDPGHTHTVGQSATSYNAAGSAGHNAYDASTAPSGSSVTGVTAALTNNLGNSNAFSTVQPSGTLNYIIKVLPDGNSPFANGVTSLGGMTGDIACGTGLTCTGNTISAGLSNFAPYSVYGNPTSVTAAPVVTPNPQLNTLYLNSQPVPGPNNSYTNTGSLLAEVGGPQFTHHDTLSNPYETGTLQAGAASQVTLKNRSCSTLPDGSLPQGCATNDYVPTGNKSVVTITGSCSAAGQSLVANTSTPGTDPIINLTGTFSPAPDSSCTYSIGRVDFGWYRWVTNYGCNYFERWEEATPLTPGAPFNAQDEFIRVCEGQTGGGPPFSGEAGVWFQHNIGGTGQAPSGTWDVSPNYVDNHLQQTPQPGSFSALNSVNNSKVVVARWVPSGANPYWDFVKEVRINNVSGTSGYLYSTQGANNPPAYVTHVESTWTPVLVGSTGAGPPVYTTQVGSYEIIGRQVTARFNIVTTGLGGVTGNMQIGGLPVAATATTSDTGSCFISRMTGVTLDANYVTLTGQILPSGSVSNLLEIGSGQTTANAAVTLFAAATTLVGVCNYRT